MNGIFKTDKILTRTVHTMLIQLIRIYNNWQTMFLHRIFLIFKKLKKYIKKQKIHLQQYLILHIQLH